MLGISALLIPAAIAVQQEFVSVTQVLYADDRNFAVDNAHDAVRITERWQQWASLLGLQENADKAQFWHQAAAGRRKLLEAGCLETQVKTDMRILGYHFRALQDRKLNQAESSRLDKTESQMLRIRVLPRSVGRNRGRPE